MAEPIAVRPQSKSWLKFLVGKERLVRTAAGQQIIIQPGGAKPPPAELFTPEDLPFLGRPIFRYE